MKIISGVFGLAMLLSVGGFSARAQIIAGPITNSANGHYYYLLSPNSWTMSEAEAESLGGTLAIIKNAHEQDWVFSTFGAYGGTNRNLWIGLCRTGPQRSLMWVTGEKFDYANWAGGQPDDTKGEQGYVYMASSDRPWGFGAGKWDDFWDGSGVDGLVRCGVIEMKGKANEMSLSKTEKALIGTWFEGGNIKKPCWIAGTDKALFIISNDKIAAKVSLCADGSLFVPNFQNGSRMSEFNGNGYDSNPRNSDPKAEMRGEIIKDKILWSDGTWWSRKPQDYIIIETKTPEHITVSP